MVRSVLFACLLLIALGGCAHIGPQQVSDADCRHVLSPDGHEVRFCENGSRVMVDQGPAPAVAEGQQRFIDDPEFLAAMIDRLPPQEGPSKASLKGGARICSAGAPGYITIRASDFAKMVHAPGYTQMSAQTTLAPSAQEQKLASAN